MKKGPSCGTDKLAKTADTVNNCTYGANGVSDQFTSKHKAEPPYIGFPRRNTPDLESAPPASIPFSAYCELKASLLYALKQSWNDSKYGQETRTAIFGFSGQLIGLSPDFGQDLRAALLSVVKEQSSEARL